MKRCYYFLLILTIFFSCSDPFEQDISFELGQIPVSSGPVFVKIKEKIAVGTNLILRSDRAATEEIPLQQWNDSTWVFLKKENWKIDAFASFDLFRTSEIAKEEMTIWTGSTGLTIKVGAKPVLTFNTATLSPPEGQPAYYQRSGFIHPLYSPTGQILTDDFPAGHTHQHGIFNAWVNTTFHGEKVDFWNQHDELGTVRLVEVLDTLSGPVFAKIMARLEHLSLKHGPALEEEWSITVYNMEEHFLIDVQSVQKTATTDTLTLNQYHYGGFAFRATPEWNKADSTHFTNDMRILTSLGHEREASNHTRPEWILSYGHIDDQPAGLAIIGNRDNFRYPQHVRIHPEMPYLCFPPVVDADFAIAPGETYTSQYRLFVFSGLPDTKKINEVWLAYQED